jgi:AcrR family transcriptional regulator
VQSASAQSKRAVLRQKAILDAAMNIILKHGFDRCGMQDIAGEAGITRAALYRYFQNKDDVLRALVSSINEETNQEALRESRSDKPFCERLFHVLDVRLGRVQGLLRRGPHGGEVSDATHRVTGELTIAADEEYLRIVKSMFAEASKRGEIDTTRTDISPQQYAELCVFSAKGLMKEAGDLSYRANYQVALKNLSKVICASLQERARSTLAKKAPRTRLSR